MSDTRHLTPDTLRRYARHIVLPDIGEAGQEKLGASSVLVIGAGGLGASALMSLAASGIGRIGIVEPDHVELSNLPRQTLYETADIGSPKAKAAAARLEEMNPEVRIATHLTRFDEGNADTLVQGYDLVIDGTDNFSARHVINDACLRASIPWVHGAMLGTTGHLACFAPHLPGQPCYRCYVPEPPERERSCAQEGILAPLAGIMGNLQAAEAIKLLLGIGTPLLGTLLRLDIRTMECKRSTLLRDQQCRHD